jgi:hypothetical protein
VSSLLLQQQLQEFMMRGWLSNYTASRSDNSSKAHRFGSLRRHSSSSSSSDGMAGQLLQAPLSVTHPRQQQRHSVKHTRTGRPSTLPRCLMPQMMASLLPPHRSMQGPLRTRP